ncbi:hypothetical protein [uncultured Dokdonia sp.]|uniref:hypothetical protein n=1 Tax=uncultured Dokdonia sp. TaxID=575653 RepID=UPI002608EDCB|nr:hypothetical protein [uncultured Dokdonia sp.]
MNTNKVVAYFLGLLSLGGISETYRILTSSAPDIAPQRGYLMVLSVCMTGLCIYATAKFWRKSKE